MSLTVNKSNNFDKMFDTKSFNPKVSKSLKKYGTLVNSVAKNKYVPIETGAIIQSLRADVTGSTLELSSINYRYENGQTRYTLKNSSVAKNRNKYEWFDRAINDTKSQRDTILKEPFKL